MREHWRELGFWRWWWHNRVPLLVKSCIALAVLGAIVVGGWFAAQKLPSANASDAPQTVVTTVGRVVTVHGAGKVVVKRVRVIQKVYIANTAGDAKTVTLTRPRTIYATQTVVRTVVGHGSGPTTVTSPGKTRTVTIRQTRTITTPSPPVTTTQWRVITIVQKQKPITVTVTVSTP
jgi:hypothetical protein